MSCRVTRDTVFAFKILYNSAIYEEPLQHEQNKNFILRTFIKYLKKNVKQQISNAVTEINCFRKFKMRIIIFF